MPTVRPRVLVEMEYEEAAQRYLRSLPLEHFMEATPQSMQRVITSESLDLVRAHRPEVQYFNELLVQYPLGPRGKIGQVVPDTMVVIHDEPIQVVGSYNLPLQPARPFWMLEYVSTNSKRKDYDDNVQKYEQELEVPYYLLFFPEAQELTLYYRPRGKPKYGAVLPNRAGRLPIRRLELEIAILDSWVRFWFRGELLPLPAEMLRELEQAREEARQAREEAQQARQAVARQDETIERMRAQLRAHGLDPDA